MARLFTLRRNLARLLTWGEVDDNFVNVDTDFTGSVDPASLDGAHVLPFMRWADTGTGWLRRRNGANDAWINEQRLLRTSLAVFQADEVPMQDVGPICIVGKGYAEWDAVGGGYRMQSGQRVGTPDWWPLRTSVPAGQFPLDGQTISRAIAPDLTAMVLAGVLPVVTEADWLADPSKRGCYTLGDGSSTIRLPDFNGKSAGSLGAVFRRGDGTLSTGIAGQIQRDALQNITGTFDAGWGALLGRLAYDPNGANPQGPVRLNLGAGAGRVINSDPRAGYSDYVINYTFDASLVARTATETRGLNVTGVWTVHAFGAVVNPGSVDAAQLASDLAVLNATVQQLQNRGMAHGQCRFNYVSPTECRLVPYNGNGLMVNGKLYPIPILGIPVSNSGLAGNTTYYAYAKDNGAGALAVEFQAKAAAPHSAHTDGVEIKTGDPTRTLVGMVQTPATGQFAFEGFRRWVASWFNRVPVAVAETPTNSATVSTSYVRLTNGIYCLIWAGDSIPVNNTGIVWGSGRTGAYAILCVDGGGFANGFGYTTPEANSQISTAMCGAYIQGTDGPRDFSVFGLTNNGAMSVTFRSDLVAIARL